MDTPHARAPRRSAIGHAAFRAGVAFARRSHEVPRRLQLPERNVRRGRPPRARGVRSERGQRHLPRPALVSARSGPRGRERAGGLPRLVRHDHQGAGPGLLPLQGAARAASRRAGGPGHRGERKDRERGPRRGAQVRRADRVRLLAAADHPGRGAGGEPRRGVPDRALPARRRRGDHAVQLPQHGARTGRSPTRSPWATA